MELVATGIASNAGLIEAGRNITIGEHETAGELHDRLAALGAELMVEALNNLPAPVAQDNSLATYAAKISKDEARIDWHEDAALVARKVRAYNPYPGALTTLDGERLKIWRARVASQGNGAPGAVCKSAPGELLIACGQGAIDVQELQRAGGKRMSAASFLAGTTLARGTCLGCA